MHESTKILPNFYFINTATTECLFKLQQFNQNNHLLELAQSWSISTLQAVGAIAYWRIQDPLI